MFSNVSNPLEPRPRCQRDRRRAAVRGLGRCSLAACSLWFFLGCTQLDLPTALPAKNMRVEQQLCVYSDFPLGPDHRLLTEATRRKADLESALGMELGDELIHVYLFDSAEKFQRYARKHLPNFAERRALFLKSDTRLVVLAHWHDGLAEDLRHELIHGYLHAEFGWIPLWLDEGLAEYFELPIGAGSVHQRHVSHLARSFREGTWQPKLERLEAFGESSNFGETQYAESWLWVHFLLNSGPERADLLRTYMRELRATPEQRPNLHSRLGAPEGQLEVELLEHLRALASSAAAGLTAAEAAPRSAQ